VREGLVLFVVAFIEHGVGHEIEGDAFDGGFGFEGEQVGEEGFGDLLVLFLGGNDELVHAVGVGGDEAEHFGHHRVGGIFFSGFATTAAAVFFFHGVIVGVQSGVDFELGDGGEFGQGLYGFHSSYLS
jgi:hypothetical protein